MEGLAESYFTGGRIFADKRLDARLGETFNRMACRPEGTLPQKLPKRRELIGGYRMFNNPDVSHPSIIGAHRDRCLKQWADHQGEVLLIHDTTVLDYSGLDVDGLGQVGDGRGMGLYAHHSLAVIPSTGQVMGLMGQILHKRRNVPRGEGRAARLARPDRESLLWKRAVADQPRYPSGWRVTDVSDRGSDITEYLAHELDNGRRFIVRSGHNRNLADAPFAEESGETQVQKLHERLRGLAPMDHQTVLVSAKNGGHREATVALAWEPVSLLPPRQARGEHGSGPMRMFALIAREPSPPDGTEALEWILLTNRAVDCGRSAREVVADYGCRWMIEDYHKAQKSGCGIEELQMTTRHGLDNAIALLSVLAVHLLKLRCAARDERTREQPARLHEDELMVRLAAGGAKHPDWRAMTVWEYYIAVAKLGGYMLNPRKRPPGWMILWRGYIRLHDMREGAVLMEKRCVQT